METLRKIIYDVRERLGILSDDSNTSDEHIAQMVISKRAKLLKYYISNLRKEVPFDAMQEICIPLTETNCEGDIKTLESTVKLPGVIETSGKQLFEEIYLENNLAKWVNIIKFNRVPYLSGGRMIHKQIYVTVTPDRRIMVININNSHLFLEDIKLKIIASDPEEADKLSCNSSLTGDEQCDFYDKPFPCEASLIDTIKAEIVNDLTIKYRVPVDKLNNAEDDTDNTGMQLYGRRQPQQRVNQQEDQNQ